MVTMRAEKMISPGKKALASLIGMFLRRRPLVKDDTSCSVAAAVYRKSYNENSVQLEAEAKPWFITLASP